MKARKWKEGWHWMGNSANKKLTNAQIEKNDVLVKGQDWQAEQQAWGEVTFGIPTLILDSWLLLGSDYNARNEATRKQFMISAILNVAKVPIISFDFSSISSNVILSNFDRNAKSWK